MIPENYDIMFNESASVCVFVCVCQHGCLYNKFDSDEIHNLPQNMCIYVIMYWFCALHPYYHI